MLSQALAEQDAFGDPYEDLLLPQEIVFEEQNQSKEENMKIRNIKSPAQLMHKTAKEVFSHHRQIQEASSRIHILGAENIGNFVAHALAGIGDPPSITILSRHGNMVRQLDDYKGTPEEVPENVPHRYSRVDVSQMNILQSRADNSQHVIDKLIVTVKANHTVPALLAIKDSLGSSSTVCFLQSGMGIIEDVNTRVFPDAASRPRYMVGMTSHENKNEPGRMFAVFPYGTNNTCLSMVPHNMTLPHLDSVTGELLVDETALVHRMYYGWISSSRQLLKSLSRCTILNVKGLQYDDMLQLQFKAVAINAILEPLSVIFDCTHGDLVKNNAASELMDGLLREIVAVARSVPELRNVDRFKRQFTSKRLKSLMARFALNSDWASGPMREDVSKGRGTDIDFINGYIVKRGRELGIPCPVNSTVIQLVKAKQTMVRMKNKSLIPFVDM